MSVDTSSGTHDFGSSMPGIRLRRLGESESEEEGDLPIPPSPDLAELCYSVGDWTPDFPSHGGPRASPDLVEAVLASVDWTPDFPSHGGPRASPDLVEAVLASVEAEDESGGEAASQPALATFDSSVGAFVSGTGVKRLLPEEDLNDAESPGPNSKIPRTQSPTTVEQTSSPESVQVGDEECQTGEIPSAQPSRGPAVEDSQSTVSGAARQPSTSSSTVPALDEGASTSLGASGRLAPLVHERDPPQKHPFVRLPVLQPGVEAPQFSPHCLKHTDHAPRELCLILRIMRELFLGKGLDLTDASNLVCRSQELARLAYAGMTGDVSRFKPLKAVEYLGRRFMVLWYLYSASQVVRQDWTKQSWWRELADRIPSQYSPQWRRRSNSLEWNHRLILDLSDAIEQLKSGNPLPDHVVVDLKRRIFCLPSSPGRFRAPSWDPWRDDDRESSN
ncbi:hypothetical protein Esti_006878 [Eimeria stiedai]